MQTDSLEKILTDLQNFKELEICHSAIQPVPGRGSHKAKIVFIGEAPGAKEDESGQPFVGRSGKLLSSLIASRNLSETEDIYITNIVKFRPPNNRDPNKEEKAKCLPFLVRELKLIKPQVIATLGRHSLNYFFPEAVIGQVHGTKLNAKTEWNQDQIFFPLYHPAVALYNPNKRTELEQDFNKLIELLSSL